MLSPGSAGTPGTLLQFRQPFPAGCRVLNISDFPRNCRQGLSGETVNLLHASWPKVMAPKKKAKLKRTIK